MMDFSDLESYYPGSRVRRQTVPPDPAPVVEDDILGPGKVYVVNGLDVEFYTIGQLAAALGRKPGTLRKWESQGILPTSGYLKPSDDPRGRRRLYSRDQCLGIIRIATDTGLLYGQGLGLEHFGRLVHQLFLDLKGSK